MVPGFFYGKRIQKYGNKIIERMTNYVKSMGINPVNL
jgi:hypothetical protein